MVLIVDRINNNWYDYLEDKCLEVRTWIQILILSVCRMKKKLQSLRHVVVAAQSVVEGTAEVVAAENVPKVKIPLNFEPIWFGLQWCFC